ncbi:MAG TPA: hypothetical protein VF665_14400 [Longimicrobium sp.]|jgi:hypothetical protein|uniref:hypothetical protein n=1 Tax=Longimicrobium sp. TaxID=2029185 RepID=UPI002ED93620
MPYDRGYGPHDGWEYRMRGGTHGYDGGYRAGGEWDGERPWVGGYRQDYQGGSGGYSVNTGPRSLDPGPLHDREHHERGFRRPRGQAGRASGARRSFAGNGMRGAYDRGFGGPSGGYDGGFRGGPGGGYHAGMRGGYDTVFQPLPRGGLGYGGVSGGSEAGGYDTGFRGAAGGYDSGYGRTLRGRYDQPYSGKGRQGGGFGSGTRQPGG